jgi:hypothetical protein
MMEGFFMSKKSDDDRMQQLQELALETVRLQARRAMSPEEERLPQAPPPRHRPAPATT